MTPSTLRDLLQSARDDRPGVSLRDLETLVEQEEKADPRGLTLNRTTASKILRGVYREVSPGTVRAVAWLAGVSDEQAFEAAGQATPGPPFRDELPPDVDNLGLSERRAVVEVVRAFTHLHDRELQVRRKFDDLLEGVAERIVQSLHVQTKLFDWLTHHGLPSSELPAAMEQIKLMSEPLVDATNAVIAEVEEGTEAYKAAWRHSKALKQLREAAQAADEGSPSVSVAPERDDIAFPPPDDPVDRVKNQLGLPDVPGVDGSGGQGGAEGTHGATG